VSNRVDKFHARLYDGIMLIFIIGEKQIPGRERDKKNDNRGGIVITIKCFTTKSRVKH
jgi:hypothetical protein